MSLVNDLQEWKKNLADLGIERSKDVGKLEQAMADLKDLGFDSVADAKVELERLERVRKSAEVDAEYLIKDFEVKYEGFIK